MDVPLKRKQKKTLGWREIVGLPELGFDEMPAKIDTGARTSALNAVDQVDFERDGQRWVRFTVPASKTRAARQVEVPLLGKRDVKNTSGIVDHRRIIETRLVMGNDAWDIEVSLADRDNMQFAMIIGRTAIRGRSMVVNPGRSYLMGPPVGPGEEGAHANAAAVEDTLNAKGVA